MVVTDKYVLFWGDVFSNFHPAEFKEGNLSFKNSEQYFMYHKALTFNDLEIADKILKEGHEPSVAKKYGRKVKNFDDNEWAKVRYGIMYNANKLKYDNNPSLKKKLMSYSGKTFVEASPHDNIWGIAMSEDDPLANDSKNWRGMNLLGKVLTELRDKYEEEEKNDEKAVLEYIKKHGVEELVELVGLPEIVYNCKKSEILRHIDNFDIYLYKNLDEILEMYDSDDEIAQYLDKNGFDFSDYIVDDDNNEDSDDDDFDINEALYNICRTLKPKGYIGKNEIKEIINDYIDFNFN